MPKFLPAPALEWDKSLAESLRVLQAFAAGFRRALPLSNLLMTLQVLYVVGTRSPWRLIELTHKALRREKRMLCFDSRRSLIDAIHERLTWQRADEKLVARHLSTSEGFPGVTADWVPARSVEFSLRARREDLRLANCSTRPACSIRIGADTVG